MSDVISWFFYYAGKVFDRLNKNYAEYKRKKELVDLGVFGKWSETELFHNSDECWKVFEIEEKYEQLKDSGSITVSVEKNYEKYKETMRKMI